MDGSELLPEGPPFVPITLLDIEIRRTREPNVVPWKAFALLAACAFEYSMNANRAG